MAQTFPRCGESVESESHCGGPATSRTPENVARVRAAIHTDQRPTGRELGAALGVPVTPVSEILMQDLVTKQALAKFVPWLLRPEQKELRAAVANDLIQTTIN